MTDLSVLVRAGDYALIVTQPDPAQVEAARLDSGRWRAPIGTFQLGIPVSTKEDMLLYQLQLLSIMSWRVEHLDRMSPWYSTMVYYLDLLIEKVGHSAAILTPFRRRPMATSPSFTEATRTTTGMTVGRL